MIGSLVRTLNVSVYRLLFFALCVCVSVVQCTAQSLFVSAGISVTGQMGYSAPSASIQPGIEIDRPRWYSLEEFRIDPGILKNALGPGFTIGGKSHSYDRVSRYLAIGAGSEFERIYTPAWAKSSLWFGPGAMLTLGSAHVFVDSLIPTYDHNHTRSLEVRTERAHGRVRPYVGLIGTLYTQPYNCVGNCQNIKGYTFEAGFRIVPRVASSLASGPETFSIAHNRACLSNSVEKGEYTRFLQPRRRERAAPADIVKNGDSSRKVK